MRSMTGYGRIEKVIDNYSYTVEIKSLNGKYHYLKTSLSGIFSPLEVKINNYMKNNFKRGNISLYIDIRFLNPDDFVEIDLDLAKSYHSALTKLSSELHLTDDVSLDILTKFREIIKIRISEQEIEKIWSGLKVVLDEVSHKTIISQKNEGEDLKKIFKEYLNELSEYVLEIENNSKEMKILFKEKIEKNLSDLIEDKDKIDSDRLELEIALLAERYDISEEIERLKSHINRFEKIIESKDDIKGMNLDFISQEMHREFNTIASKSKSIIITNISVEGRATVNKIREQAQNVM